jgi:hypothetical protein
MELSVEISGLLSYLKKVFIKSNVDGRRDGSD